MKDKFSFLHASEAHRKPRVLKLRRAHGWQGYGVFWAVVEVLREGENYRIEDDMETLSMLLNTPQSELSPVIETCVSVGLLTRDSGFLEAPSLTERMKPFDQKRESARERMKSVRERSANVQRTCANDERTPTLILNTNLKETLKEIDPVLEEVQEKPKSKPKKTPKPAPELVKVSERITSTPESVQRFEAEFDPDERAYWLGRMEAHAEKKPGEWRTVRDIHRTALNWRTNSHESGKAWNPVAKCYQHPSAAQTLTVAANGPPGQMSLSPLGGYLNSHEKNLIYKAERKARLAALDAADAEAARTIEVESHDTNGSGRNARKAIPDVRTAGNGRSSERLLPRPAPLLGESNHDRSVSLAERPREAQSTDSGGTEFDDWEFA